MRASLGLREAKELTDRAPVTVIEGVPREQAEALRADLEAVGATARLD